MKNTRDNRQTQVKNCLKWTASGLLLALMFVLVFAGTLSGAFGIENELQQNGIIQSNVASAAGVWYGNTANAEDKFSVISLEDTFRNTESKTIRINPNVDKRGGMWTTNVNQLKVNTWETDGDQGGKWYIGKNDSHTGKDFACAWFVYDLGENYKNRIYGNISISFTAKYTMWDAGGMIAIESGDNLVELPQSTSDGDSTWYDKVKNGFQNTGASCTKTAELVPNTNWIGAYKETTHDINLTHNVSGRYIRLHFATYDSGNYNEHQLNNVSVTLTRTLAYNRVYDKNGMKSDSVVDAENNLEFMANSTLTSSFYVGKDQYFTNWNTSADGSGVAMAIGASTGTSTAANTFGGVVKSNLQNGQTTTTLYAQYKEIPFVFNGTSYATYNPIIKLVVLENTENYMSSQIDGYNTSITYQKDGVTIPQPKAIGNYTATITVKKGGVVRGTRTVEFEVVEGDFGKIQGGTGKWGSVTNPYVISNETHLKNLSAIVNGRDALNSIVGSDGVTAEQVVATNKTYKDCYFVISANLGADTPIELVPIGKDGTHYFAGTIFGGNDSDATNRTMRTISLNIQSGDVSNVGLFGYVKGASISYIKTAGTIVGGSATGGLVGCMENGEVFNCANSATVTGRGQVGGIVGYNLPSQRGKIYGTIINNGAINGTNMVGGLVGQWHGEWNLNGTYGTFTNTGNVNGGTGASVGGIAGFADRTIKNAANSGNVVGGTSVGGIAGRCQAPIENSYNTGDVRGTATTSQGEITGSPTGVFVGGITGYTSANASISNCYNTGHISALSTSGGYLSNANYVGGIVGFAQAAVSYCANIGGLIEGNDYLGGIVGNSSSTIDHCYDVQGQRKHRYDTGRIGAISGYGGTATNSWAINAKANDGSTCSNPNPTISNVGKVFVSVGDVAPAIIDGYTEKVWTDILTIKINGFKATATVNNGKFLASATASNGVTSVVPAKIDGALTANANGASAQQTTDATLTYWYNANTSSNIYVQIKNINGAANVKSYNGANQTIDNVSASPFTATAFYFDANYAGTATDGKMNVGTYSVIVDVVVDGNVVGRKLFGSWTINTRIISQNSSSATYYYGARILSPDIADILSNIVNGHSVTSDKTLYNFYDAIPASGSRTYTITYTNIRIVANGSDVTGNYKINNSYTFTITVNEGDFGVYGTTDIEKNPWGSVNNPYVIRTQAQLERLSAIVASGSAVNSIYHATNYPYVKAINKSFANAYFVLDGNISMSEQSVPIGNSSTKFSGTFDGKNHTISNFKTSGQYSGLFGYVNGARIQNLTVNVTNNAGATSAAGLVGVVNGTTTIRNCTVNGTISGTHQVGGFVGFAQGVYQDNMLVLPCNLTIEGCINNATVTTTSQASDNNRTSAGGFVGYVNAGATVTIKSYTDENGQTKKSTNNGKISTTSSADNKGVGGFVGYSYGKITLTDCVNEKNATITGKERVGGLVGYIGKADSDSQKEMVISGCENKATVTSNSTNDVYGIGGIVGYNSGHKVAITNCINSGAITGTHETAGIIGYSDHSEISNCTNSGAVSGFATVGGIVGKMGGGSIVSCKNTATVKASKARDIDGVNGAYLGGIAGWANGNVNNCYNSGTVTTETSWGNSNIVGGIVGFLVNGKTVSYCYNSGTIVGSSQIGGIIGYLPGALTTVTYCYHSGRINSVWNENNVAKGSLGYITGNDTSVLNSCWILPGASTDSASSTKIKTNGRKLEVGQYRYVPAIIDDYSTYGWTDILTKNINGFRVQESVNPGASQFFESKKGSNSTTHLTPNKTESSNQANALNRDNTDSFTITAWYDANTASDIYCAVNTIAIDISADTYNNAQLGFTRSDVTTPGTSGSVYGIVFDYKGKNHNEIFVCAFDSNGNIVAGSTNPTQVDTYNTTVFVKIGDIVVGKKIAVDYTIEKAALNVGWTWTDNLHANLYNRTGSGDKVQFVYNGKAQGLDSVSEHLRDVQLFDVTGNDLTNTNAATYTRTYTLKDTRNYKLQNANNNNADLSGTTVTFEWKIRKNKLTVFNRWVAEDFGKDSNLYTFEYNTTHRGLLTTNDAITFLPEKATDNTRPEFKQGTDYTISEHQNAINVGEYSRTVRIINTNYEVNNTTAYVGSSSNATVNKGISVNGLVVTYTWKIVPYSLATNIISGNVWFGGTTNLIVGNQGIANVNVGNQSYADKRFYPLQSEQNGVQKVLVYAQHNYAADKFVLYVKYNNGTVAVLTQGTEYTLSALDAPTVENPAPLNTSVTASGTGNFSGNITKYYTAMFSDFGWKDGKTPEDNDWGGSADNPYVISKPEHLLRLSQIVNGGTAWNSINTTDNALCIAPQTTAKATSRDYNDAYFLVTVDIDMSGYISTDGVYNFLPIGTRSTQNQTELPFSATFDGGDNTITYVYNVGSFYNVNGARKNYVGLFGYLNGATISNLKVASNGGLSITDNSGIVGIEYVGGIAGYAVDSTLYNSVLAYGGWVRGETYVGGIVGYGERITIVSSEAVSSANVGGETYVGGIVGKWIVSNQNQIGGSFAGQAKITLPSGQQIHGVKYVGGIAGWMDTSSCATTISYAPQLNNNGEKVGVYGTEYVGALFGALIGNGYHQNATNDKYTAIVIDKDASDNFKVGNVKVILQNLNDKSASGNAKVVGGLVGYAEGVGILFNTDWTTSNVTLDTGNYTPSFIGGIAGVLGKNATIEAKYQLKDDGTFLTGGTHTITHSVPDEQKTFGTAAKPLGSFVGGIVGYVSSQAGVYWETGTTIFGNGISLVNLATIYATSYAGGIFGALGDLSTSVAQTFENDTNSILYNVLTTGVRSGNASTTLGLAPTVSGNGITAQGRLVNNASISVSGSYVGGIAGYSGAKVRFVLRNTPQDSAIDVSKLNIYSGGSDIFINGSYAGGIAGYLADNLEHELQYIVVQAKFDSANAKRVGGLVGYMGSGKVERCVVTSPDGTSPNGTISAKTDNYQGSEYVGGLVGETQNATIRNSVSTGFNLEKTSNTKGGLLGYGANPTIDSSWTFYIANSGATYSTVSKNTYGKYILVDNRIYNNVTFADLCKFAGITQSATAGILEFAVRVPRANDTDTLKNKQLAFYNASGSDTETSNKESFKGFDNSNNVLTIKLDMASGTSMQVCVVDIEFVNVPQHDKDNDETAHAVVESKYKKPSNSTRYHVDVTQANFDIANTKQVTHIKANVYFECNGTLTVISDGVYFDLRKVGDYDSGILTPGNSAENPLTISSQEEWNDFAWSIYTGANDYAGQYVKLLARNIVIDTGENKNGKHKGTKFNYDYDFTSVSTPNKSQEDTKNANSNMGYNLAGNISQGSSEVEKVTVDGVQGATTPSFKGHFDGNGNTIEITYTSGGYHRISVFPNAAGATFKHLTIKGTIQAASQADGKGNEENDKKDIVSKTAAYDIAGFVGKPFGTLKFYNCKNEADIIGLRNVGGIVGYNAGGQSITLEACVNTGDITSLQGSYTLGGKNSDTYNYDDGLDGTGVGETNVGYTFGTGGIIGSYIGNIQIESCRNSGKIIGGHNVGGIIGLHNGKQESFATLTINNCANTGDILANSGYWGEDQGGAEDNPSRGVRQSIFGYAGGLVGKTSRYSSLKMFASYNMGTVITYSNIVGGLVGAVGALSKTSKNTGTDTLLTGSKSVIAYCYNNGTVHSGGTYPKQVKERLSGRENYGGTISGGIAGIVGNIKISNCYNTGDIIAWGVVGYSGSWQLRSGGIVGQSEPTGDTYVVEFETLYNAGSIMAKAKNTHVGVELIGIAYYMNEKLRYGGAISGYCDHSKITNRITSYNVYSIKYPVGTKILKKDINSANKYKESDYAETDFHEQRRGDYLADGGVAGIGASQEGLTVSGTTFDSYEQLTARLNAHDDVVPRATEYTGNNKINIIQSIETLTEGIDYTQPKIDGKMYDGWIYVYGCLPQLAMFALDTQNGLSMHSVGYRKDQYGEYNATGESAGSDQYPYIIKDGIDLMGMQALVDNGFDFNGKIIEFANSTNNLSGVCSETIVFPTTSSTSTNLKGSNAYKAKDSKGNYHEGKSYHLFAKGALCNQGWSDDKGNVNSVAQEYGTWIENNYRNLGESKKTTLNLQNFIAIGRKGNSFKGTINGQQGTAEASFATIIDSLRVTIKGYKNTHAGLFSTIEDAIVQYVGVGGNSQVFSHEKAGTTVVATAGGIVGMVYGNSVVENCIVKGSTVVGAYGANAYAGGIAGMADPKQGTTYNAGITLTIRKCSVSTSGRIESAKSNIGGVLGYIEGIGHIKVDGDDKDYGASGKSNSVRIEGCEVQKAAIQAASSANTSSQIGGILGYGSEYVAAFITGCKVGVGGTVSIKGEHSLGGIAGGMSNAKGGYIDSCTVGANTTIERIAVGNDNTVSESPKHGTAIGGLVGFTQDSKDDTSPLTTTFSGTSAFGGTITVSVEATNKSQDSDAKISCIGGIVGDMGSGANFASGSNVTVGGNINITLAAANVGGVVGRTNKATFIGKFNVAPNMSTENAENVGGFIGKNIGTVYILADTTDKLENTTVGALNGTEITIGGKIKGTSEVGGFIGVNNSGSTLNIGSNVANAKPYKSGTLTITITASVTGSGDNVGGIVGKNEGDDENTQDNDYATIDIVKGTIEQNGAIIGANNVGGIIGLNDGLLTTGGGEADTTIGGVTLSEEQQNKIKNLSINNTGSVTGTGDYVGGVVGKLDSPSALRTEDSGKGAIAGTFTNSGNVSGGKFVGGSLGYVGKNVTITAKNNVATLFVNDGEVNATGYFVGGSIGALVGKIQGENSSVAVKFENKKKVNATGFVGGSIGVLAGPVSYAQFVNSSDGLEIAAVNSVGGSVGYIGVPSPLETILTGVGITLADDYVKVENTRFEASGELTANPDSNAISVAKDAATNKSTGWGGVGGAIGVIGKNVRWGTEQNKNTYYANGNVTANGINNVGGIVGIILAENVNISNMLAYNTTVKGGENVGGIVGATDGIGTVITSAYAIEGTFTGSKNVGGIIGLAKTDTDASTSYWVKGYTNAILAGTDVKNLQQDLGKFETIIEYVGEQPIVFTEEFCKMYTPKTYYDDYPGTHTYNGKTITLGENVEQLTWYDYFKDKLGETSAQIKNGAWVKPIANAPTYTTGANNTGWYFVYATDKTIGTINAEHSTNANLQYWKRIADAYTSSERNEGRDDNVKNPLASDIVLGNGAPQKSTLYATATAAGTESGYYLYMATSGKSRPSATNQDNKFYIQTLTTNADALAENVAVYYRTISKGKALTFNGYLRYAPVGITASEGETVSYIKNPETATGKPNSYCYSADTTTAGGQGTDGAQTNPGSFHSQVNIYYFDSEGKPHVVGGVAIGWTINKRDLTAEFTANTDRTYGEDRKQEGDGTVKHDMKLVVGNIAPEAGKNSGIVITISSDNESYTFTWDGTSFDKTSAGGIVISAEGMTDPGATNGWDASDSLYNVTEPDDKQTKDFSCFIDFTNAKMYTISVTTTATSGAQYTLDKTTNFSVKQATLTLKGVPTTNNPDSVIFDNKTHAFSWKVEGFKYNDDISQLALFSPTAYALGKSAPLFNSGTPNTMKTGSVTIDGVENVTYTIYSNSNSIDISGARDKGEYYIAFATLSAGNYKLKLDKGVESLKQSIKLSISDNKLKFDWRGAGGSHPYDKNTKETITLTITAKSAIDGFENFVKKFFAPTMSGTGANAVWGTASDNKSITITFTTGVNAGTYTATIAQNENETAFIEANKVNCSYPMIPQSRSYKIDKRNLTITLISKDNKTSYTYNGQHQGLVSIRVNSASGSTGLISGDSVNATVSVSREGTEFGSISVSAITSSTANNVRLSTINFGKYIATVTMAENTNYTCQQSGTLEWEIKQYQLTLSDLTGGQKVYDGIATKPTLKVNGVSVDNGEFTPSGVSGDRIAIKYSASIDGQSYESIVNAGKYSVSIGGNGANAITVSPATRDGINTADNYSIEGGQSVDYVILPRTLKLSWQEIQSFVFSNTEQGLIVVGVEGVEDGGNGSLAVKSGTSTINGVKLTGYAGGDTIEITIIGALLHANSTSKMEAKITSVSGTNKDGSNSIEGNYTLSEDDRFSGEFTITPSVVSIKFNAPNATLTKVYDGNRTVPTSQINDSYFSWSATGHNPTRNPFKVTAQYDNKNVGDKKAVTFSYTFTDPTNVGDYVVGTVDGSAYTVGQITPAHIRVALDKLRSGKATRTYTDDEFYGGADGATGNGRSKTYRTGEGFTVSGVLGSDNINVVARYQEADNTRNSNSGNYFDFSKYVNDVYKDANGTFKKASAGTYFKKLVFTMTGTDAANYTFNVYDSSAEGGNKYSESDSTAAAIQSVTVYDSRDSKNNKNASGAASIQIEITVKSVRVEYSDTAQSYANDDNTYNTDWKPITGTNKDMDKADAKIKVSNGWMYADGKDHTAEEGYTKREYRGYTTIRGSQNSERLGAKVDPTNGMDLNYRLSNQPTLTIAYFVSTGDEYEINSLARLLIASFYYTASQNPGNLEIIKIVSSGYKWVSVVSADDYDKGEFELPQDTPITDSKATTWDEYFTELEAKGYSVFLNIEANAQDNIPANTWGYYATTTSESSTIPTSYKLTKDIVGKFTESDISILNTFFTVIGDDGKTTTSTWSGNGTYLKNVLKAAEGKIATINGSLFVSTAKTEEAGDVTGFGGTFDGNGYVIEYLNIMGYGKDKLGLFDVIGANGIVKNLHLRNVTINGNAKYVGGIAGKVIAAAEAALDNSVNNVSFHGSINVTGSTDQSVGGLFGISERAVENAIVLGSITVSNVNAKVGGVVGTATAGLNNVVSMMQITASGGTVGAFTSNNAHVGENCTHMTNAVWKKGTSGTGFENVDGKNVGYNDLMSGSVSGYGTTNKYYHESETSVTKGEYDVLDDVVLTKISVDNKENARQSMRLADIVKVYLLMYSLNETQATDSGNLNGANVYAISTSSWLVGTADGTTAKPIAIANKQNVSLLRELRFASFTLKANVSIEIASTFSGAFYGSVTSATNESGTSYGYKITCDKAMFEAYSNDTTAWLSVQ